MINCLVNVYLWNFEHFQAGCPLENLTIISLYIKSNGHDKEQNSSSNKEVLSVHYSLNNIDFHTKIPEPNFIV